jgi:hypothetical protein
MVAIPEPDPAAGPYRVICIARGHYLVVARGLPDLAQAHTAMTAAVTAGLAVASVFLGLPAGEMYTVKVSLLDAGMRLDLPCGPVEFRVEPDKEEEEGGVYAMDGG